jgi:hypothetical protein
LLTSFLPGKLPAVQLGIQAARGQELVMGSVFADLALVDDQDLVGLADGGQPVRDNQRGAAGQRGFERPLNGQLGLGVQVGGGLVQDDDRRRLEPYSRGTR